jgi:hypothetical protein
LTDLTQRSAWAFRFGLRSPRQRAEAWPDQRFKLKALDLAVEALQRVGGVKLDPVLGREAHVSEHVRLGVVHQCGELWQLGPELVGDRLWLLKNLSRRSTALQSDMLLAEWSVF